MNESLNFEAFYPHSPERVWKALTEPAALARWLLPTDFEPRIGFRFRFENPTRGVIEGVVLESEPGKRLRYTWEDGGEAGQPGVVTWTLEPKPGGTRVRLQHQPAATMAHATDDACVLIEASANWRHAVHASLPLLLKRIALESRRPPTPIVYVEEEPEKESGRRAGFRQPATAGQGDRT